jgi:virulence-associated protein VagC
MLSEKSIMPIRIAKIINDGNNQTLALPKEFSFDADD